MNDPHLRKGRAVRIAVSAGLLVVAAGLVGCQSTSKDRPAAPTVNVPGNRQPFWEKQQSPPASIGGAKLGTPTSAGAARAGETRPVSADDVDTSGVLAGKLIDSYGRQPGNATIQFAATSDMANGPSVAPEVSADPQGYFIIQGLKPGKSYLLTARWNDGGRAMAGSIQATPPNVRLVIKLREDMAAPPVTPTGGGPPAPPLPRPDGPAASNGSPTIDPVPRTENIAEGDRDPRTPPATNLPGGPPLPEPDPVSPPPERPSSFHSSEESSAPTCRYVNGRLEELVLTDAEGHPWDFRKRHGRLLLLDFWGTHCVPCLQAIPHVKELQRRYGAAGLEVVGIACERPGSDRAKRVRDVQYNQRVNYRMLLADETIQEQFRVEYIPFLVLIDDRGMKVWSGGANQMRQLEATISARLNRP